MNKRALIGLISGFFVVFLTFWIFHKSASSARPKDAVLLNATGFPQASKVSEEKKRTVENPIFTPLTSILGEYPPWHGGRAMSLDDPRWNEWRRRRELDPSWQWKIRIDFYGKVVDATNQPVSNVLVNFSWTDTSGEGSSKQQTESDANGLFELHGVNGKNLGVEVEKQGYEIARSKNRYSFEYASFGDVHYYEADPKNPVIFYVHKKGETAPLIYRKQEMDVTLGIPVKIKLSDQTQLEFTLLFNDPHFREKWEARVLIVNGGIIPAPEEFIIEAPVVGYQTWVVLNPRLPKPPTWELYEGGSFYLQAGPNYGRMDIEMLPGKDSFRVITWLNPKAGSRNIEDDPAKHIDPDRIKSVGLEKAIEEVNGK